MKPSKKDIQKILSHYNLGDFKKFGIITKNDVISLSQVIYTTKKKIFMKIIRTKPEETIQSLNVAFNLWKKGYPVYEIYQTKKNKTFLTYKKYHIVLMEFAKIPAIKEWPSITLEKMKDYAKQLVRFHILTKSMRLNPIYTGSFKDIQNLINKFYKREKDLPNFAYKIISSMKKEIPDVLCKSGEYKSGYFSEYNPGHVYFKKNKVNYVIDWEIGKDYSYYDIGSSAIACFTKKGLSYKKLRVFLREYNKVRKLSKWEKKHIYEAIKFGAFKYSVWNLIDLKTGDLKKITRIKTSDLSVANYMVSLSKEEFNKKLKL